jgi:hypothetical protein
MMDEQLLQHHRNEIRTLMQKKFCENLFRSPEFPFLPSIGITHLFQSFEAKEHELGFLGILHVWYHEKLWQTEWIDTPEKSMALISHLQKAKLYDEVKLVEIGIERMNQHAKKERMKVIRERINRYDNQENIEDEDIVLN